METKRGKSAPEAKEESIVTSEVSEDTDEKLSTSTSEVDKMTLEEYLSQEQVNPGLVASFRVENKDEPSFKLPKTKEDWKLAFDAQSNRTYE